MAGDQAMPGDQALARETFSVFGTTGVLIVTDPRELAAARRLADAELGAVDAACSRFRPDSELSRLNAARGQAAVIGGLFAALLAEAIRAAELTDGAVDPTCGGALKAAGYDRDFGELRDGARSQVPATHARPATSAIPGWRGVRLDQKANLVQLEPGTTLDLGATAKAWAADSCANLIAGSLGCGVLVSLGGDIAVAGPPPDVGWHVRVTDDHGAGPDAPGQTVAISSGGLATSSTTVRAWTRDGRSMHHIIDPATGQPAVSRWRTVSVAAATCSDANIASTAAIVRSETAVDWLTERGLPARLVRGDGTVVTTPGWPPPRESGTSAGG